MGKTRLKLNSFILSIFLLQVWCLTLLLIILINPSPAMAQGTVQVIENKDKPSGSETLVLKKKMTIGKLEQGGSAFGAIAAPGVTADGRIVVLDSIDKKIKIFDSSGKPLREFGREGQGPGEWISPLILQMISDEEIMVSDTGNRKLVYFDLEGKLIKEVSYAKRINIAKIYDSQGQYVACEIGPEAGSIAFTVAKYDANFSQLFKIDTLLTPLPLGGTKINFFDFVYDFCLDSAGNIIYSQTKDYEIKYFTPDGQLFKIVRKKYRPQTISEKDKEEMLSMMPKTGAVNMKEMVVFPEKYPPFRSFCLDEQNRLYVRTYEKGKTPGSYLFDIFNPEGKFIARCEIPSSFVGSQLVWKGNRLYNVEKDEEGYQYIVIYEAKWVEGRQR